MASPEFDPKQESCVGYRAEGEIWCVSCTPTNDPKAAVWSGEKSARPVYCYVCGEPLLRPAPHKN